MKYTTLPNTDIKVSKICLGTMTWGEQNTEAEGHEQIEFALEKGVNFLDTAEMYSIPGKAETQGSTEKIIGSWFKKSGKREDVILTSKVVGPGNSMEHIRDNLGFSKEAVTDALHKSLKRLQTDYIDLYQLHWPERNTNFFGKLGYEHDENEKWEENFQEVLQTLNEFVKEGKIRQVGLSNETPYGLSRFLEESRKHDLPKMITVQNPYNLLNRKDEIGLTEILHRENVGLFPYSPLGMGTLSGKHLDGIQENSRLGLFPQYKRYSNEQAVKATKAYAEIAKKYNLNFAQMSLAFVNTRPFVTSNIIGATSIKQLEENIGSIEVKLSEEVLEEINKVHETYPNPAP
ncbi:NADP(H)-dependent aldo-keto reductase [Salegentibacter sp. BDJ18]|jgi:aryl-alcohol dehydrogenase-like predicted oxidoreductase|uniref:NADP(H)-dependent aldo-keto reductase n=1 Tax=Salegentibacter sp. BDJ18 TaxID=2816376 RepID=UPI001AAF8028|nr:NADP(H)-dependent aldo-keto reductase [Salegentibacter sp. BDJ18]MBO2543831.1 NADP(H)-dependent aldo-keto reductase [Salegentibacter sp. BDJ18]|tara:strand:+ start:1588 stop:2625 length:1038 start_codon:yes stop_codon:yes gene_type:complete